MLDASCIALRIQCRIQETSIPSQIIKFHPFENCIICCFSTQAFQYLYLHFNDCFFLVFRLILLCDSNDILKEMRNLYIRSNSLLRTIGNCVVQTMRELSTVFIVVTVEHVLHILPKTIQTSFQISRRSNNFICKYSIWEEWYLLLF